MSSTFTPVRAYSLITHTQVVLHSGSIYGLKLKQNSFMNNVFRRILQSINYSTSQSVNKFSYQNTKNKCKYFDQILMDFYELLQAQTYFRLSFLSFSSWSAVCSLQYSFCILPLVCSLHFTLGLLFPLVRSLQSTVRSPQSSLPAVQSSRSPQSAVRSPQSAVRSPQSAVRSPQSAVRSLPFALTVFVQLL